jgi:3-phosphoshikimate 1-carboxyvinyltransferase
VTELTIVPGPLSGRIRAPPSKSYTHRGAVIGHLTGRPFHLTNPLDSEDTHATFGGLLALGSSVERIGKSWEFRSRRAPLPGKRRAVRCGSSGTTLRFLLSVAALEPVPTIFEGTPELSRRPLEPLLDALERRGAKCLRPGRGRSLPVTVRGPLQPGEFEVTGEVSSQFLSSLLLVAPVLPTASRLRLTTPLVSRPYIDATLAALRHQGVRVDTEPAGWRVEARGGYRRRRFDVTGDASSAAFLWSAAAISGGTVEVTGIDLRWPQADLAVLKLLELTGSRVQRRGGGAVVGGTPTRPFEFDFTDSPDLLPIGGVLAAYARGGPSRLDGAAHAAFKESDRLRGAERLARCLGAKTRRHARGLVVIPGARPTSLRLPASGDHRIVMAAAVAALGLARPSTLRRTEATGKSFPGFWNALRHLGAGLRG